MRPSFRILYWLIALIIFSVVLYFAESIEIKDVKPLENSDLIEIPDSAFYQNLYNEKNTYCVFFYMDDSPLCNKMEININKVKKENFSQLPIYKLNAEKYPDVYYDQNLSGLPLLIIYAEGKEAWRVMGKVSTHNLNLILERALK